MLYRSSKSPWPWSYGSWIYNFLCNQCLSPLMLWVWIPLRRGVLDTTLCNKVCQWLAAGQWFSQGTPVSSINKTDCHDNTEILLKVTLNTITIKISKSFKTKMKNIVQRCIIDGRLIKSPLFKKKKKVCRDNSTWMTSWHFLLLYFM
jgi:hypothetical protein